ncbi:MAG: hypothetical protein CL758_04460 [Chloroflexi bacterium]|nr:hypothetical protein [Chloroflexota bacterium]
MLKVTELHKEKGTNPIFIVDFSPPKSANINFLDESKKLNADYISVSYNPAKSIKVFSMIVAQEVKQISNKNVIFSLATRDMNKLSTQSILKGAQLLGLDNLIVFKGDKVTKKDIFKEVDDYTPTSLIKDIIKMNEGKDLNNHKIQPPSNFCVGAAINTSSNSNKEIKLTKNKLDSGAHFLISQPSSDPDNFLRFHSKYIKEFKKKINIPIFHGILMINKDSLYYDNISKSLSEKYNPKDSDGTIHTLKIIESFLEKGINSFYLIPPIYKNGLRDYKLANFVIDKIKNN